MSHKSNILVVDDELPILKVMEANLKREGYRVETCDSGDLALERLADDSFDTVIVDYLMPGLSGLGLMKKIKDKGIDVPVIVVTAHGTIEQAVQAMQMGALNYLTKPVNYDELLSVVKNAVEQNSLKQEVKRLRREVTARYSFDQIIGKNEKMQEIFGLIADVAETDATVLIRGETGTGKELIARALHFNSPRKNREFLRVNCAALSETLLESELFGHEKGAFTGASKTRIGRFEQADSGTIFLDEIGDIPLSVQSKLLRVLQEREFERLGGNKTIKVDVRIISATNQELEKSLASGSIREDLYYRLNVIPIFVPPLRERPDDIPPLALHFVKTYAKRFKKNIQDIQPDALALLMSQDWPGNVRQLENMIERAVIMEKNGNVSAETISLCFNPQKEINHRYRVNEDLPLKVLKEELVSNFEKEYIQRLLEKHKGNITAAAQNSGLHYKNFCGKMKKYEISKWDFKD